MGGLKKVSGKSGNKNHFCVVRFNFIEISIWAQLAVHNSLLRTGFLCRLLRLLPNDHHSLCRCTQLQYDVTRAQRTWSDMAFGHRGTWLFPTNERKKKRWLHANVDKTKQKLDFHWFLGFTPRSFFSFAAVFMATAPDGGEALMLSC